MDKEIISFKQVKKIFSNDIGHKSVALDGATFSVKHREIFGVIGLNGAGKSTALKILLGLVHHDHGEVSLMGQTPTDASTHNCIGYLPENPCLYNNLTITDHLTFAGRLANYPKKQTQKRTEELLELVELQNVGSKAIRNFSKGMTQRAALAYALFHEPKVLILDEPMSGLDPIGRKLVIDIINNYNTLGNTVLFCSHILSDVARICDRVGIMHQGKIETTINTRGQHNDLSLETLFLDSVVAAQK